VPSCDEIAPDAEAIPDRSRRAPRLTRTRATSSERGRATAPRTAARPGRVAERVEPSTRTAARRRAADLVRELDRIIPKPLDGDYRQAIADGAVEEARRRLERRIRAHMQRCTLTVALTDNRFTMISVRREPRQAHYRVRLHHMFADAGPTVTRALARYIAHNNPRASRLLGDYIDTHQHRVRPRIRRRVPRALVTVGEHFDLQELFDDLNARYFEGAIAAQITWGVRGRRPQRRNSIKMGSYSVEDRLIRIHRTLDRSFVPRFFVEWIVYHEMLHQVHVAPLVKGRRRFHTPEFLVDEARFEHYDKARAWERANLERLLTF
jgi:hypothetical protein